MPIIRRTFALRVTALYVVLSVVWIGLGDGLVLRFASDVAEMHRYQGQYVVLSVADTGCGIDADVVARMFEPFFTTKPAGKGTGLGLSTVHGIVKQARGFIDVASQVGIGTTFRVYLPRVSQPTELDATPAATPSPGGRVTVLLVEDDDAVRAIARRCLERGGYTVIEAAGPSVALAWLADEPYRVVDLLLTDVILPEMHGPILAQKVRDLRPDLRVLLMSGYLPGDLIDKVQEGSISSPNTAILTKPFTASELLCKVREVLDEAPIADWSRPHVVARAPAT